MFTEVDEGVGQLTGTVVKRCTEPYDLHSTSELTATTGHSNTVERS